MDLLRAEVGDDGQLTAIRVDQYAQAPHQVPACVRSRLASRGAGTPDP